MTGRRNDGHRLPVDDVTVDLAPLAFALHELDNVESFLVEPCRILAPRGRPVVLECVPREEPARPPRYARVAALRP